VYTTDNTAIPNVGQTLTVSNGGPFGSSGTITLRNDSNEVEPLTVEDLRQFKAMVEFIERFANENEQARAVWTAIKTKKRILK
jgi:hypothetical protein